MTDATLFERREGEPYRLRLARIAQCLHVPMTHSVKDEEFMPVLSYRVDQEIAAAEQRLADLKRLRDSFTA